MWLVICEPGDASALWAYQGLQRRGLTPLELLSPDMLACSLLWEHRIDGQGAALAVTLASGRQLNGRDLRGVLNRTYSVPLSMWRTAAEADRLYVQQELFAFYLSWLHGLLCPVFNRPTAMGLAGPWRSESEWVCLAAKAGLPTPVFRQTSFDRIDETQGHRRLLPATALARTVITVGAVTAGAAAPPAIADGCLRLAALAETALLGVDFIEGDSGAWTFAGATPLPELSLGGEALLDALTTAMRGGKADP
jgi:hypothetical protein